MQTSTLLHNWLDPLLPYIHVKRLTALFDMVAATVSGSALSVTSVGRRLTGMTTLKHKIKRADRLIGNTHLYSERKTIYSALCRIALVRIVSPMILIDWSDLKADQSLHLLRASVPVGGRSLTLYEEVHPQKFLGNRARQHRFLRTLATLLPPGGEPIIVADSGFRVPFFREVERLGWRWIGRVRGRDYVRPGNTWISYKSLFKKATTTARRLGLGVWVKSDPFAAILVLVRLPKRGRTDKTASGRKVRSKKSRKAAQSQGEPWLLVASPRFSNISAKALVKMYRQRMQIEESFRDMKSLYFGQGFSMNRSRKSERVAILVLIASIAAFLLWLIGLAAEQMNLHRQMHASSERRRIYSLPFLASLILIVTDYKIKDFAFSPPDILYRAAS